MRSANKLHGSSSEILLNDGILSVESFFNRRQEDIKIVTMYSHSSDGSLLNAYEKSLLTKIYHLRYQIYCQEYGFFSHYSNDNNKTIVDKLDCHAFHILATVDDKVIGCARFNLSSNSELGDFERLLCMLEYPCHPNNTGLATKLMVISDYRSYGIDKEIINTLTTIACNLKITNVFLDCRLDLEKYYRKIGLLPCGTAFEHYETGKVIPMMIDLLNVEYLSSIRSPLIKNTSLRKMNGLEVYAD